MLKFVRLAACACFAAVSSFSAADTFSPRMVHSGVAQGQYPDTYLAKIAASGVDSVIVNITDPLTGAYAGGTEDLNALIRRAAGHGIGVYAYADFPVLSEKLHPAEPGAREDQTGTVPSLKTRYLSGIARILRFSRSSSGGLSPLDLCS